MKFFFPYFGPLVAHTVVTKDQLKDLKNICNKKISHAKSLAGHFETEYRIDHEKYGKIISPQLQEYKGLYKHFYNNELTSIEPDIAWVNYMKAGDYNPPHLHTKCRFSSVLFLQIPKKLKQEHENFKGTSEGPGALAFIYGENIGEDNIDHYAKFPEEGDMFIFPSFLKHYVHPFKTKNVERISIAANYI